MKNKRIVKILILSAQIGILIFLIALWEILAQLNVIDTFIMSSPSRIVNTIADLYVNGNLFHHVFTTLYEAIIGFLICVLLGILLSKKFSNKYSTDKLNNITIVFICTDEDMIAQGFYKERRYISWKKKYADIRLMIPYAPFIKADQETKKRMIWDVIERALEYVRMKNAFVCIDELTADLRQIYWQS